MVLVGKFFIVNSLSAINCIRLYSWRNSAQDCI
jgi:hypothetical protein